MLLLSLYQVPTLEEYDSTISVGITRIATIDNQEISLLPDLFINTS